MIRWKSHERIYWIKSKNVKEHNPNWPQILYHPYRILIVGVSGSGKTNPLFHLIIHQPDPDKVYLYTKNTNKAKYQLLIYKRESVNLNHLNYSKDIYKNIEEYNPNKKQKRFIVFDDTIA